MLKYSIPLHGLIAKHKHVGNHNRNYFFTIKVTNYAMVTTTEYMDILVDDSPPETGVILEGTCKEHLCISDWFDNQYSYSYRTRNEKNAVKKPAALSLTSRVGRKNPQKLTQLSSRSHQRHLVEKRTAQKDITIDITSDSQVNSNFPNRWSPASLTFNNYFYLF